MRDYKREFDYDLMSITGRTLHEYMQMGGEGVIALSHFAACLPLDSATICAESGHDMQAEWSNRMKTNAILADLYDLLGAFVHIYKQSKSRKRGGGGKKPERYPRPWLRSKTKKFGKDPIPVRRFWNWWNK